MDQHRFTAMSILHGSLRLRSSIAEVQHDDQVWNGAGYTNWSYGVPLLQASFHALLGRFGTDGFFFDRAIYFAFCAAFIPVLWNTFDRVFSRWLLEGAPAWRRHALSWTATWATLASALYPLMHSRFLVYEETVCYFVLAELLAVSAYVALRASAGLTPAIGLATAAGLGLLIRPTGVVYLGVWAALVALERRPRRTIAFAAVAAPLVGFWLFANAVRTGSPFGLGYANTNPFYDYHIPIERFGTRCLDSPNHALEATVRLFAALFIYVPSSSQSWLDRCHFAFDNRVGYGAPMFDPPVVLLVAWVIGRLALRRERALARYVPLAAMAVLLAGFVRRGQGFVWRYVADFWPLAVLLCVQELLAMPRSAKPRASALLGVALFGWGIVSFLRFVEPWDPQSSPQEILGEPAVATLGRDFAASRSGRDKAVASRIACRDRLPDFFKNGVGWGPECEVGTFTNIYLGVPAKDGDRYQVRFETEGIDTRALRVYVNGRIYEARRAGDHYEADVTLRYADLTSPIVLATVEWTRALEPPPARLRWIELD